MQSLLDLLFPRLCSVCEGRLSYWEKEICTLCLMRMPLTRYHEQPENPVEQVFWGRIELVQACSLFIYKSGSKYGNLLHRLKYEQRPHIGLELGRIYGEQLKQSTFFHFPDLIIPIPLHPRRQKQRGYNQSEMIAKGLSDTLQIPISAKILVRNSHTQTQTAKSRADRYLNVQGKFTICHPDLIIGKHLLLVDDVITTGATMEACAEILLQVDAVRISLLSLAFADKRS